LPPFLQSPWDCNTSRTKHHTFNKIHTMNPETFKFLTAAEIFLLSPDEKEVLLMHRSKDKDFLPDYYSGLGGKMDSPDVETPLEAAFREIEEESSYELHEIENFQLKGIITVSDRIGKWIVFEFAGKVTTKHFPDKKKVDEGILEWVSFDKLSGLKLIPDLRNGVLEKIVFADKFLWIRSVFDKNDKLVDSEINPEN